MPPSPRGSLRLYLQTRLPPVTETPAIWATETLIFRDRIKSCYILLHDAQKAGSKGTSVVFPRAAARSSRSNPTPLLTPLTNMPTAGRGKPKESD